jgi:hypothetical protein
MKKSRNPKTKKNLSSLTPTTNKKDPNITSSTELLINEAPINKFSDLQRANNDIHSKKLKSFRLVKDSNLKLIKNKKRPT